MLSSLNMFTSSMSLSGCTPVSNNKITLAWMSHPPVLSILTKLLDGCLDLLVLSYVSFVAVVRSFLLDSSLSTFITTERLLKTYSSENAEKLNDAAVRVHLPFPPS